MLGIVVRAPRELLPVESETATGARFQRVEDVPSSGDYLATDTVGGNGGDTETVLIAHGNSGLVAVGRHKSVNPDVP